MRRFAGRFRGLLAQVPSGGGSTKDILDNVCDATWDAQSLALLTMDDKGTLSVEFPAGRTVLQEDAAVRGINCMRLAKDGNRLAMIKNDSNLGTSTIEVVDRQGARKILFTKNGDSLAQTLTGLAWGPGGEIWFTDWEGDQTSLWALSNRGKKRLVWRGEGCKQLLDISSAGKVLMASQRVRRGVFIQKGSGTREISILGGTQAAGLSDDGRTLLLLESPALDGGTAMDQAFVYHIDQEAPAKLTRGNPLALSPDGLEFHLAVECMGAKDLDSRATAAFQLAGLDPRVVLDPNADTIRFIFIMPTGPGRSQLIPLPKSFQGIGTTHILGKEVIFQGQAKDRWSWFFWTPGKGEPRAFTPEGLGLVVAGLSPISPDRQHFIATGNAKDWFIVPIHTSAPPQPIRGLNPGERIIGWGRDGRSLFIRSELSALPVTIFRLDLGTGARTLVRTFTPADPAGHLQIRSIFMTGDAQTIAYTYDRKLSELFEVGGLAP